MAKFKTIAAILMTSGLLMATGCANTGQQARTDGDRPVAESTQPTDNTAVNPTGDILSPLDEQFVVEAAQGGMTEVEIGQLAVQKATNGQVKQFAQRMVQDHSQANSQLQGLAQAKNITLPPDIGDKNRQELEKLSKLSGAEFDEAYMDRMVDEHQKDIELFQSQAKNGRDPDLKNWAATTLPALQSHQELARSIESTVDK